MDWLKSKATVAAFCSLGLIALLGYTMMSTKSAMNDRVASIEGNLQSIQTDVSEKVTTLESELNVVTKKMGITTQELQQSQGLAKQLQQENSQMSKRLRKELAAKADAEAVSRYHDEANTNLKAVQLETTTRMDG